jgi:hypothetical protein
VLRFHIHLSPHLWLRRPLGSSPKRCRLSPNQSRWLAAPMAQKTSRRNKKRRPVSSRRPLADCVQFVAYCSLTFRRLSRRWPLMPAITALSPRAARVRSSTLLRFVMVVRFPSSFLAGRSPSALVSAISPRTRGDAPSEARGREAKRSDLAPNRAGGGQCSEQGRCSNAPLPPLPKRGRRRSGSAASASASTLAAPSFQWAEEALNVYVSDHFLNHQPVLLRLPVRLAARGPRGGVVFMALAAATRRGGGKPMRA